MRRKNLHHWLLGLIALLTSAQVAAADGFKIKGEVDLPDSGMVVIHKLSTNRIGAVDTVYTDADGRFEYAGAEAEPAIYYLTFGKPNPPGVPVMVHNGLKIKLKVKNTTGFPYEIEGGALNRHMHDLHGLYTDYDAKIKALNDEVERMEPSAVTIEMRKAFTERYNEIMAQRRADIDSFIDVTPPSPVLYYAVRFLFAKPDPVLVVKVLEKMELMSPESAFTKELIKIRQSFGPIVEGLMAPDIALRSVEGDTLRLSSLRGKVVLIDFWASWCGPCRKENPHVVKLYDKYKDKGFEIYGVSLDNNARMWQNAIVKDSLSWWHVSDLKGWSSAAAKAYGVHSIPDTFLIDAEGKVYRRGLRSEQLDKVLGELLGDEKE